MSEIRNFVIIAHVDHGKSTLADRFLELTGTIERRKMREQFLDMHPLERERGITIKMQPVRMTYRNYILNLIDTPGHSDFSYEVSRALAAVEGAILLVDATQGVQAQTVANLQSAQEQNLVIIPAVNKIDLASAEVEKATEEVCRLLGVAPESILRISGKEGTGVEELLNAVIERVPAPTQKFNYLNISAFKYQPLRALVFDSVYDPYQGVIAHVRMVDGEIRKGDRLRFLATGAECEALELGYFLPERASRERITAGEIGYVATGVKEPERVRVGDTITRNIDMLKYRDIPALPGYREPQPVVFASVFPENQDEYARLFDALKKLRLEDAALFFEPEDAGPLGRGFRAGFLGLLHMEIASERLRREYGLSFIFSKPSVAFRVRARGEEPRLVYSAAHLPSAHEVERIEEPYARLEIFAPASFAGALTRIVHSAEGSIQESEILSGDRIRVRAHAPLRRVIVDFYDTIKSVSRGYATFSYTVADWRESDLVRLDIAVAGERVPAFSEILPRLRAYETARSRAGVLKELLPRELFPVSVQGICEGRVIARETIPALKKNVTAHLYGGDRTRKMKLWKKQQKGKKRLRETGHVDIPPEVFLKMMKR